MMFVSALARLRGLWLSLINAINRVRIGRR